MRSLFINSSEFPNTQFLETLIMPLVSGNPDETLAFVYEYTDGLLRESFSIVIVLVDFNFFNLSFSSIC